MNEETPTPPLTLFCICSACNKEFKVPNLSEERDAFYVNQSPCPHCDHIVNIWTKIGKGKVWTDLTTAIQAKEQAERKCAAYREHLANMLDDVVTTHRSTGTNTLECQWCGEWVSHGEHKPDCKVKLALDFMDSPDAGQNFVRREEVERLTNDALQTKLASALAHRGCCGSEDDPANGKLHGYCVVCGVPWPCETAKTFLFSDTATARIAELEREVERLKRENADQFHTKNFQDLIERPAGSSAKGDGSRFDPEWNCPTHFAGGDPDCPACIAKQPFRLPVAVIDLSTGEIVEPQPSKPASGEQALTPPSEQKGGAEEAKSPFGDSSEVYYCKRDDFVRYIEDEVNPARKGAGLAPLDMKTAEECYRILNDFAKKWITTPATSRDFRG